VATDETGIARSRILATVLAPNQTAQIKVTDVLSGAYRLATFAIAQYNGNSPAYFTLPSSLTLTGPSTAACSSGSADVAVFGGTPPYAVVGTSSAFFISVGGVAAPPAVVASSGGKFTVNFAATGQCVENIPVAVTDATGRTLTVTVTNKLGTVAPAVRLEPNFVSMTCGQSTTLAIVGGTEPFAAGSSEPGLSVTAATRYLTIMDAVSTGTFPRSATVTVTDGATTGFATVNLAVPAVGPTAGP
jgi:hypothetical protein